jgi:acetyl-CoA carboxylase biotin carboxyl carrier protein
VNLDLRIEGGIAMPGKTGERPMRRHDDAAAVVEEEEARVGRRSNSGQPLMDLDFVRGLITAVDQSGIDSLEINRAGARIRISKTPPPIVTAGGVPSPPVAAVPAAHAPVAAAPAAEPAAPEAAPAPATNLIDVKSPMVGTFYRAPAPEAPPYTEVGSQVTKGQTLCILEAMKLMNELESEVEGVVREILVSNAEPVEYGQVLFRIEPSGS